MCSRERTTGSACGRPQDRGLADLWWHCTNAQVAGCRDDLRYLMGEEQIAHLALDYYQQQEDT